METDKKGIFITGTDTGVGKTIIAAAIIRRLISKGFRPGAMKPVETGCRRDGNTLIPGDGSLLQNIAKMDVLLTDVTPYMFESPVAPFVASEREGKEIREDIIIKTFTKLSRSYDFMVVEGVGGLMVPIRKDFMVIDLIRILELPVIIVARNALGTINHTLLTVRVALDEGLTVKGIIINNTQPSSKKTVAEDTNPLVLKKLLDVPLLGVFPYIEDFNDDALDRVFAELIQIESLLL